MYLQRISGYSVYLDCIPPPYIYFCILSLSNTQGDKNIIVSALHFIKLENTPHTSKEF